MTRHDEPSVDRLNPHSVTRRSFLRRIGIASAGFTLAGAGFATNREAVSAAQQTWFIGAPKKGRINCNWHSGACGGGGSGAIDIDEFNGLSNEYDVYGRVSMGPGSTWGKVRNVQVTMDCDYPEYVTLRRKVDVQFQTNTGTVLGTGRAQHVSPYSSFAIGSTYTTPKNMAFIVSAGGGNPGCWGGDHVHFESPLTTVSTYPVNSYLDPALHTPWKKIITV